MVSLRAHLAGKSEMNIQNPIYRWKKRLVRILILASCWQTARAADTDSLLANWFATQTNLQAWSADFVQTRTLKSLVQPLTSTGHVWFATPNRFRWELGQPPQTIAVRNADEMLVIYPPMKRAEHYPLRGKLPAQWRDSLALLDAGLPRSQSDMDKQFEILAELVLNDTCQIIVQPKSSSARKLIPQMRITFDTRTFLLRSTELQFADGSTMKNEFSNATVNVALDETLFSLAIDTDFKITEPLKK